MTFKNIDSTATEKFKIERQGFTWEPDEFAPLHDEGMCDACNNNETAERCEAWVVISRDIGQGSRRLQRFESGGLNGICGADDDYRHEVEREEYTDLREHCAAFGVELPPYEQSADKEKANGPRDLKLDMHEQSRQGENAPRRRMVRWL